MDSRSGVNIISQAFAFKLDLKICNTDVGAQKIDSTTLETYKMIVSIFSILDKNKNESFFEDNFLFANINLNIMLKMLFLTISNTDIDFPA